MEIITLSGGPTEYDGQRREVSDHTATAIMVPMSAEGDGLVFHEWRRIGDTDVFEYVGECT